MYHRLHFPQNRGSFVPLFWEKTLLYFDFYLEFLPASLFLGSFSLFVEVPTLLLSFGKVAVIPRPSPVHRPPFVGRNLSVTFETYIPDLKLINVRLFDTYKTSIYTPCLSPFIHVVKTGDTLYLVHLGCLLRDTLLF